MNKLPIISAFALLTLFSTGCNNALKSKEKDIPKDFDYGKVISNKYKNTFFNMEMDIPKGWVVQTREQTESMASKGADMIAGDDKNMKAALKASEVNSANLLGVFKHEPGAAVEEYNANFMLVAENLKNSTGIKTGREYLFQTKLLLKQQTQIEYQYVDADFKKMMIGNQEFYTMNTVALYMGVPVKQVYYSTVKNGFCLTAIISYQDDVQKPELEKTISSMKFSE